MSEEKKPDIFKWIKDTAGGAANTIKNTADGAAKTIKDIKLPDVKLPEIPLPDFSDIKLPEIHLPDIQELKFPDVRLPFLNNPEHQKDEEPVLSEEEESAIRQKFEDVDRQVISQKNISNEAAARIAYYLMAIDQDISGDEQNKYEQICSELVVDFASRRDAIESMCKEHIERAFGSEDYIDNILDGVTLAVIQQVPEITNGIPAKLLLWNLIAIAYSDGGYNAEEQRLIKSFARNAGIDLADLLEMENSYLTLKDLYGELEWIKTTDRQYLTIEPVINQIQHRIDVIQQGVEDLIGF